MFQQRDAGNLLDSGIVPASHEIKSHSTYLVRSRAVVSQAALSQIASFSINIVFPHLDFRLGTPGASDITTTKKAVMKHLHAAADNKLKIKIRRLPSQKAAHAQIIAQAAVVQVADQLLAVYFPAKMTMDAHATSLRYAKARNPELGLHQSLHKYYLDHLNRFPDLQQALSSASAPAALPGTRGRDAAESEIVLPPARSEGPHVEYLFAVSERADLFPDLQQALDTCTGAMTEEI